jgi:hypothetical protein
MAGGPVVAVAGNVSDTLPAPLRLAKGACAPSLVFISQHLPQGPSATSHRHLQEQRRASSADRSRRQARR